jgi:hypothetical protein
VLLPFEVSSYDDQGDLFPLLIIYDTSTGTPVFLETIAMTAVLGGTYVAFFSPVGGKSYLLRKAFYTDDTYATLDPLRSPASETIYAEAGSGESSTYTNEMSTAYNNLTLTQEVIAWATQDGQSVSGTDCTVTIKDSAGTTVWTATLADPNGDGVFLFSKVIALTANEDYYVVVSITVDGAVRTNIRPFMTVG